MNKPKDFLPLEDIVAIEVSTEDQTTEGGVILPEDKRPNIGIVYAVGGGRTLESGSRNGINLLHGDVVRFSRSNYEEVELVSGKKLLLVRYAHILGVETY